MSEKHSRRAITVKRLRDQLRFAASAVNAYCEKLTPDIFGKYRDSADAVNQEFYALSSTLSDSADAVATLADWLLCDVNCEEEFDPENTEKLRRTVDIAVSSAELFEDISVSIYSHICFEADRAVVDVAAVRRDAVGFLIKLRDAVASISEP